MSVVRCEGAPPAARNNEKEREGGHDANKNTGKEEGGVMQAVRARWFCFEALVGVVVCAREEGCC